MAARNPESIAESFGAEMRITRWIDAPKALIWKVWTDPEHLARWWGPNGFRTTTHELELREGGVWRHTMHGPDGTDFPNRIRFREVLPAERLVYAHDTGLDDDPEGFITTVTFTAKDGGTEVVLRGVFRSPEARQLVAEKYGALEGGRQTLGRLADQVAFLEGPVFELVRTFDAPRELVWKAWTESAQLAKWWGPAGFEMLAFEADLRPGGRCLYGMRAPNGMEMWGKFLYRDVVAPERLLFVISFSDPQGGTTRHFASPTWPLEVLNELCLEEQGDRTRLTLRGVPVNATAEERRTFEAGFPSMQQGFKGTLDQLAAFLATH